MIRIQSLQLIPIILQSRGAKENQLNCNLYHSDSNSYDTAIKKFEFKSQIYGHTLVKNSLRDAQHKKCCYCESIFEDTSYGVVEHFRPKGAVTPEKKQQRIYPGYYWLAYEWKNLLFACSRCNTNKSDYFPLVDNSQRAKNHTQSLVNELPLFIHPVEDEPSDHINFHNETIVFLTKKGEITIDYLGLNRADLFESRKSILVIFEGLVKLAQISSKDVEHQEVYKGAIDFIKKGLSVTAKYSAMTNAYFKQFSHLPEFSRIRN